MVVEDEVDFDKINVGCTVKVFDITFDEEMEFKIVGSTEANSLVGKISNESPVGQALIGKKVGDTVSVETQAGEIKYKVLEDQPFQVKQMIINRPLFKRSEFACMGMF